MHCLYVLVYNRLVNFRYGEIIAFIFLFFLVFLFSVFSSLCRVCQSFDNATLILWLIVKKMGEQRN